DGLHENQISNDCIILANEIFRTYYGNYYQSLFPAYYLEPLIKFDENQKAWPHLAESIEYLSPNEMRIHCRQGIKWAPDRENIFTNEYFDAEDVYFTIFYLKECVYDNDYYCIQDMQIIDQYTIDLTFDFDTPYYSSYAPYRPFYDQLSCYILPEHYLNQSQKYGYPDVNHIAWEIFETHPFGTGLFEVDSYSPLTETVYSVNPNCWWLNDALTNDSLLNWEARFGSFENSPHFLKILPVENFDLAIELFKHGNIDFVEITGYPYKIDSFSSNPDYNLYDLIYPTQKMIAYNIKPNRGAIGSMDSCPNNPEMTVGVAIRKALSHAINSVELNNILYGGKYHLTDYPISETMGIWCNPNIIRYDYNLQKAREYLYYAGYGENPNTGNVEITFKFYLLGSILFLIPVIVWRNKKSRYC
ncbi:MAG: ABC transporter substrate-binding protein, partial [Candidatus Thorarchaeota archaeon]